jgi:hypothetical protein
VVITEKLRQKPLSNAYLPWLGIIHSAFIAQTNKPYRVDRRGTGTLVDCPREASMSTWLHSFFNNVCPKEKI